MPVKSWSLTRQPARTRVIVESAPLVRAMNYLESYARAALRGLADIVGIPYGAMFLVFLIALMLSFALPDQTPLERVIGAPVFGLLILVGASLSIGRSQPTPSRPEM